MAIINIMKDGTVVDDMSKVTVPEEIIKTVIKIIETKERNKNG